MHFKQNFILHAVFALCLCLLFTAKVSGEAFGNKRHVDVDDFGGFQKTNERRSEKLTKNEKPAGSTNFKGEESMVRMFELM